MRISSLETNTSLLRLVKGIAALFAIWIASVSAELIDRIVAIVEDDVVLESVLARQVYTIKQNLAASNTPLPPDFVIKKQVLEQIIINRIQLQIADRLGITVDDKTMRQSTLELAQRNGMTLEEFRQVLKEENISYANFIEDMRNEILIGRLRSSQVNSKMKITDRQVKHYMETEGSYTEKKNTQYRLAHILIATPEAADPKTIQSAKDDAENTIEQLHSGVNFRQLAISISDGGQALNGGDLGWRKIGQIPTLFVKDVTTMGQGDIEGPIRSPSGFHIIKLVDIQGANKHIVSQTHARHILIKINELINDEDAEYRLETLKQRIEKGEDFANLARSYSDDKASALKGGDLGWVEPGALVPPFEQAMNQLLDNEMSAPVQTQFGWHLIQVLERQKRDNTAEYEKEQAREQIAKRKIEEETEIWLRRIRDEAYVEIKL